MDIRQDITQVWEELAWERDSKIIFLVLDGMGGLPERDQAQTELQAAHTPNLDHLAATSSCGLLELVGPGITPGSGPGHLSLFGYDPLHFRIGRGVLSALGIDFDLKPGNVAARVNFASVNEQGEVTDRRAGRIATDENRRLCDKIRDRVHLEFDGQYFLETVSEHRAVLVLRGTDLGGQVQDTDPQSPGQKPFAPTAQNEASKKTAELVRSLLDQIQPVLADESPANMILLRGFERYEPLPSLGDRFCLNGLCIADYPMYRGVSRLIGMDVVPPPGGLQQRFEVLKARYGDEHNFYFIHVKKSDSTGEDANFAKKVKVLEEVDQLLPELTALNPSVLVVTADHSTPASMGRHSWHPVPVLLHSAVTRVDSVAHFDEFECLQGALGQRPGTHIMGLALAHAGRLRKFGA
jgi:2,3-bisphosphoglycerate-independent phosphoglycerate mutase